MLKNYFKIAIAVLKRRKVFTFISLFGISFTLTILMVGTAFLDKVTSADYPDYKRDRSLYVGSMELQNSKEGWLNRSDVSLYFFDHYVSRLKNVEKMGISSYPKASNAYINNKKIVINYKYTNADYWRVLEYRFLEGKPYAEQQIVNAERVAVISETTKKAYFGNMPGVVGQYISADEVNYRVIGVVSNVAKTMRNFAGDMFLPYTVSKENYTKPDLMGPYSAVLLARSKADVPKMKLEFDQMMKKVPIGNKEFDRLYCNADYFFASITRRIAGDGKDSGITKAVSILVAFVILFLLLPTINLVNINITRIMERSSEIGVRKAFGASSRTLVCQFIVENMILTFLGGVLGLLFSALIIYFFNSWNLIDSVRLSLNFSVLLYSFLACVFFGLISGVYPAWRMSRLNVVKALKAQ
ncbi:ABC transporter permease [Pedobacter sp.]|jgi:putative ABC transport system permease protein|uniref:ABC transporter permease n=1 Tax=Pedobacter sp. TaxID=1411316 RepID=UPI002B620935|nr:FtsX-like permease family protein [Pedobacter sp.]HWW39059.1 FtsX-like permease family protein [Pedobacter sp.]